MKNIKMYLLQREEQDDDYVGVLNGTKVMVVSDSLKHIWTNPERFIAENLTFPYTLETYYGDVNILDTATLIWECDIE